MTLTNALKKQFKQLAHDLNPIIITGQHGISENLLAEIDRALNDHELIKIRVNAEDRIERKALAADIIKQSKAELIQSIGHIIVVFRQSQRKIEAGKSILQTLN